MNIKHVSIAFSLLFLSILPVMGMNEQNNQKWLGICIDKQKSYFNDYDIQTIANNDIDKGILLEQHLGDIQEIESFSPLKRKGAIAFILKKPFMNEIPNTDKQQKLMGLIECASFIGSPIFNDLIDYALDNNLISQELLKEKDDTDSSFLEINNIYNRFLKQYRLKINTPTLEYPFDHTFNPITNDIKARKYTNDEVRLTNTDRLIAFDVDLRTNTVRENNTYLQQRNDTIDTIAQLFNTTSLPNKIKLILNLNNLNKRASNNIEFTELNPQRYVPIAKFWRNFALPYVALFLAITSEKGGNKFSVENFKQICCNVQIKLTALILTLLGIPLVKYLYPNLSMTEATEVSFLGGGGMFGLTPLPQLYMIYKYFTTSFPFDREITEMKQEKKNIQNLLQEFQESVKKDYSL